VMISSYFRRAYRASPGTWAREGEWLVARWKLRYRKGRVFELETAIQIDEDVPAEPPSVGSALAAILLPAMRRRPRRVHLPRPLDATMQANLPGLQAKYVEFFPERKMQRVPVRAAAGRAEDAPAPGGRRVGVFASLGVDSFSSILTHLDEIDDLIIFRGGNIGFEPENDPVWSHMVESARTVAEDLGKRLIPVRTNIRTFIVTKGLVGWGMCWGATLAHIALLLQPWLHTVYLPASCHFGHPRYVGYEGPMGSHPQLDPLWSSDQLRIIHDGGELARIERVHRVAQSPVALRYLQVCNTWTGGAYNCGQCAKCLHTMMELESAGVLKACATLPDEVTASALRAIPKWGWGVLFLVNLCEWWRANDPENEMLPIVEGIIAREGPPTAGEWW
jgi:hypothetical protein